MLMYRVDKRITTCGYLIKFRIKINFALKLFGFAFSSQFLNALDVTGDMQED